ncbi:MAG: hypothetical protein R2911_25455 [Caldilineaceae bacterium]
MSKLFSLSPNLDKRESAQIRPMLMGAIVAVIIIEVAVWLDLWWLCVTGLVLLGCISVLRPALWLAALLLGLPFYFWRDAPASSINLGIIDVGVLGGSSLSPVIGDWGLGFGIGMTPRSPI